MRRSISKGYPQTCVAFRIPSNNKFTQTCEIHTNDNDTQRPTLLKVYLSDLIGDDIVRNDYVCWPPTLKFAHRGCFWASTVALNTELQNTYSNPNASSWRLQVQALNVVFLKLSGRIGGPTTSCL